MVWIGALATILIGRNSNTALRIQTIERRYVEVVDREEMVYNFQVEDFYTYYVGDSGILVHNVCGDGSKASTTTPYELVQTHSQTRSKSKMNELINEIKQNGIKDTIRYVEYNGQKYIVDGHHRVIAAKGLGIKEVPIEQVQLPYAGYNTIEDLLWFN